MSYDVSTANTLITSKELVEAAVYVGFNIYSKPYTDHSHKWFDPNFTYTCRDGTVINRPNHNIANILRSLHYLNPVLEYLRSNGNTDTQSLLTAIDDSEIEKILYMQLFYTSGRNNELGFVDDPQIAQKAREDAGINFVNYIVDKQLIGEGKLFKNNEEVQHYAKILERAYDSWLEDDNNLPEAERQKSEALRYILLMCHEMDLLRCYTEKRLLQGSFISTLNHLSKTPNNRDMQQLLLYAQRCITATGDTLRTQYEVSDIHGVHVPTSFHRQLKRTNRRFIYTGKNCIVLGCNGRDDTLFKAASRVDKEGIYETHNSLSAVPKPVFFQTRKPDIDYSGEDALALIESGDALSRTLNGAYSSTTLRFEIEQLVDSKRVRPIRPDKLKKRHNTRIDLQTGAATTYTERDYISPVAQNPIIYPKDWTFDNQVSKQEDRGKPKNTLFQKKCSYSLVPKTGIFAVFKGRRQDRIRPDFVPVGFLHDAKKMVTKGERYIWKKDVSTSGIGGYFWLAKNENSGSVESVASQSKYHCKDFAELKKHVNLKAFSHKQYSELLACGSVKSLTALYVVSEKSSHLLAALHMQCMLRSDYNIERPIIILNGKQKPRVCNPDNLARVFKNAQQRQQVWWRRLFNLFFPSREKRILTAIEEVSGFKPFLQLTKPEKNKEGIESSKLLSKLGDTKDQGRKAENIIGRVVTSRVFFGSAHKVKQEPQENQEVKYKP